MTALGRFGLSSIIAAALAQASPAVAQEDSEVPYWASIASEKINMRVGPGTSYPITWVYKRVALPVRVLRRKEGWRFIEDPDGVKGWMLGRFLSRKRTAFVHGDGLAEMREKAGKEGRLIWRLEPGVTAILGDCEQGWCRIELRGRKGFAPQDRLWGAGAP